MTINVSCVQGDCGTINVSLDPEMIKELIEKPGHSMLVSEKEINNGKVRSEDNLAMDEKKSFFEKLLDWFVWRMEEWLLSIFEK